MPQAVDQLVIYAPDSYERPRVLHLGNYRQVVTHAPRRLTTLCGLRDNVFNIRVVESNADLGETQDCGRCRAISGLSAQSKLSSQGSGSMTGAEESV